MKTNENGRSMIEMLGVLAIIGVLSVGGIYGYTVAMRKYKANEIVQTASMLATIAQSANAGEGKCVVLASSGLETSPGGTPVEMFATKPEDGISAVTIKIESDTVADGETMGALCKQIVAIAPTQNNATAAGYYVATCNASATISCEAGEEP